MDGEIENKQKPQGGFTKWEEYFMLVPSLAVIKIQG